MGEAVESWLEREKRVGGRMKRSESGKEEEG